MKEGFNKKINILKIFQYGVVYMETWPAENKLALIFPENRVIKATKYAIRIMPFIAIFTLTWQIALEGNLGPAIATALFACTLPLQGLWWLGKRAISPLPARLLTWFYELREKLTQVGEKLPPIEQAPTYQSLAELLKFMFRQLDKTFLDDI